jgi:adenylate kinase family enzyme
MSGIRRVLVVGSGGAGKSTFAARLGASTGLPVHHLDAHYWQPGWVESTPAAWAERIALLVRDEAWIMDGNYGGTIDQRLAACDTVVFLDLPRTTCLWRILRRWWRYRGRTRPDLNAGCPEQLSWEFVRWVWTYPAARRPAMLRRLQAVSDAVRVVHLRSSREADAWLAQVEATGTAPGTRTPPATGVRSAS